MRNLFVFVLIMQASLPLFAWPTTDPYQVCDQLPFTDDRLKCLGLVEGKYFDPYATYICSGLIGSSDRIECLDKISNKTYTQAETSACSYMLSDSDKVDCLDSSGQHH